MRNVPGFRSAGHIWLCFGNDSPSTRKLFFYALLLSTQVKTFAIARNVTSFRKISHVRARSLLLREITPLRARSSHFARDCTQIRLPSFSEKYLHLKRARFCVVSFVSLEVAKKQVRLQLVVQNTPVIQRNCARNGAKTC